MLDIFKTTFPNKSNLFFNITKIFIIIICAFYLLGNFSPFFEGQDSYLYGIQSVFLSNGIYEIPNPLLKETGRLEFTGGNWNPTIHGTMIPIGNIGTPILGTVAYLLGGYYGLFYLGPILGITLLILYERITTKLFGKYIGLLSLLFLATCHIFFRSALLLNTDAIFTLFFFPGIYYLIIFLHNGNEKHIFLASIFFVLANLIKIPGLVLFPLEVISVLSLFFIRKYFYNKSFIKLTQIKISKKNISKIILFSLIPWIIFFSFWFSYNDYFYGDFTNTYHSVHKGEERATSKLLVNALTINNNDFEQFKDYAKYLLPYQFPAIFNTLENNFEDTLGQNWIGLSIPALLAFLLYTSFKQKSYRIEFLIFTFFIFGILWFHSGFKTEERASFGVPARYMLPIILLSFIAWSFLIVKFFSSFQTNNYKKYFKLIILLILGSFFVLAFYFSPPIQFFVDENFFKDPSETASRYPLELEGIAEKSIVLSRNTDNVIEYGLIPFHLPPIEQLNDDKKRLLSDVILDGYSVYIFKEPTRLDEKEVLISISNSEKYVFKDFSSTFCMLYLNDGKLSNDSQCLLESQNKLTPTKNQVMIP